MGRIRRVISALERFNAWISWRGLGVWTALAVYFTAPVPFWLAIALAALIALLYASTLREKFRLWQWFSVPWADKRFTSAALCVSAVTAVYFFFILKPDPNLEWAPEQARVSHVEIDGDKVHVRDVRNFTWRTATDFTPAFYERTYDVSKLNSMYYVVVPLPMFNGVAHVFVSFGFSDGQHVAVSVEGRRQVDQTYQLIPSMFKQYQLIYIVGDERDVVGLRGNVWQKPVYFYPARTTDERKRAIFLDMMQRAHDLEEKPEFYDLVWNNCMTNITAHIRRLGGRPLPSDLAVLLTGFSDRVAHRFGFLDTDLPFAKARETFRVDEWMRDASLDDEFSKRLRENIAQRVAEAEAAIAQGK